MIFWSPPSTTASSFSAGSSSIKYHIRQQMISDLRAVYRYAGRGVVAHELVGLHPASELATRTH